jgi:hypothetical protein
MILVLCVNSGGIFLKNEWRRIVGLIPSVSSVISQKRQLVMERVIPVVPPLILHGPSGFLPSGLWFESCGGSRFFQRPLLRGSGDTRLFCVGVCGERLWIQNSGYATQISKRSCFTMLPLVLLLFKYSLK